MFGQISITLKAVKWSNIGKPGYKQEWGVKKQIHPANQEMEIVLFAYQLKKTPACTNIEVLQPEFVVGVFGVEGSAEGRDQIRWNFKLLEQFTSALWHPLGKLSTVGSYGELYMRAPYSLLA